MSKEDKAVNTIQPAAVDTVVAPPTLTDGEDLESKIVALEAEKAQAIVEASNWKVAALKAKSKQSEDEDESEEERIVRIVNEKISETKIANIDAEKDALLKKALKENKELKLAQLNKNTPPAIVGTHSEGQKVQDTLVTPEQMAAFKAKGWSDKDIERYKKNIQRYGGR